MMLRRLLGFFVTAALVLCLIWASLALYFDFPVIGLRNFLAPGLVALALIAFFSIRSRAVARGVCFGLFLVVLAWWLTLSPSNDRNWLLDVAQTPWAEIDGDRVTLHNVRNFDYVTETDYKPNWETRTVDVSQIRGIDLYMNYWGSPSIAHTILSFQFANSLPIAISIETRKVQGQSYATVPGFFRQYSLVYVVGDERDLVRLRTNYRIGEDLYIYRTELTPQHAREVFLDYLKSANELRTQPVWYNALTTNCTTSVMPHLRAGNPNARTNWDWRILLNGYADQMAYEAGKLAGGLPFEELKRRAHINDAAKAADKEADFSVRIRAGRPGFN